MKNRLLHMRRTTQAFLLGAAALCQCAHAAAPAAPVEILSPGTMLQFALGLGAVLALIVAAGWVMKKSAFGKSAPGMIKVVAGAAVGQRERVVIVEVNDTWLVLGVAAGRVSPLHTMPRGQITPAAQTAAAPIPGMPAFATWLKDTMEKRRGKE